VVRLQLAQVFPVGRRRVPPARDHRGQRYHRALRGLAARWTRVLWRCWVDGTPYDPTKHANTTAVTATA
jgi:hypothetical protein